MSKFPREVYQLQWILDRYVVIHDKIFKFSLREVIPIPGLFKPIDFGQHSRELDHLISTLEQISTSTRNKGGFPDVFQQYVTALLKAMQFLRDICRQLYDVSQGDLKSYKMGLYKSDVTTYEGLVEKYLSLGLKLNEDIHK